MNVWQSFTEFGSLSSTCAGVSVLVLETPISTFQPPGSSWTLGSLFIQQDRRTLLRYSFLCHSPDTACRPKAEVMMGSPHLLPFYPGSPGCPGCWEIPENSCCIYFAQFSSGYHGRVSPDPVTSSQPAWNLGVQTQVAAGTKQWN